MGQLDRGLAVRPAAVIQGDDAAVVRALPVGADPEDRPQRTGQSDAESAVEALARRLAGHGRRGAAVAVIPPLGGIVSTVLRQHPGATQAELPECLRCQLGLRVGVRRDEAGVVRRRGQQVAGREVLRLDAVAVGDPGGRDESSGTGQQHDLVDGDRVGAIGAGHRDGPLPTDVRRVGARKGVGHHQCVVGHGTQVLADRGATNLPGHPAGQLDRGDQGRVGCSRVSGQRCGRSGGGVGRRQHHISVRHDRCCLGPHRGLGQAGRRREGGLGGRLGARGLVVGRHERAGYPRGDVAQDATHSWHGCSPPRRAAHPDLGAP